MARVAPSRPAACSGSVGLHAVAGRPHERAGHVFGVDEAVVVGRLNGHDARVGGDPVDADAVVVGGNDAGDVRAVVELVAPPVDLLRCHTIDRALHGTSRVDAPLQVRVGVLDAGVHDGHAHGRAPDVHHCGLGGLHLRGPPVEDGLPGAGVGLGDGFISNRAQAAGGSRAARLGGSRAARRRGFGALGRRLGACRGGQLGALVVEDGGHAGRANGMDAHPRLLQGGRQVGGEGRRGALGEERADLGVGGERCPADGGNEGERTLKILGAGGAREVDRVVHLIVIGARRGDEGGGGVGMGGRSGRRGHAHGQGEGGDDPDACGGAAHDSSAFVCHCQDVGGFRSPAHHPRLCQ